VQHQRDAVADEDAVQELLEVGGMGGERVAAGDLVGFAHADQVRGDAAAEVLHVRENVAPEVGRRRVAVQEDDRLPGPGVHVRHLRVLDADPRARERVLGRDVVGHAADPHTGVPTLHLTLTRRQAARSSPSERRNP
jgi:hypothetical protein